MVHVIDWGAACANACIRSMELVCQLRISLIKGLLFNLLLSQSQRSLHLAFNVILVCCVDKVFIVNLFLQT